MNEKIFKVFQYCKENNIECKYNNVYFDGCEVMNLTISFEYNKDYIDYFKELNIFNNISTNTTFGGRNTKLVTMSCNYDGIKVRG